MKSKNLNNIRPILSINDNCSISRYGSYAYGYKLELNPVFSFTASDYERCTEEFSRALNVLVDYCIVHKQDIYTKKSSKLPYTNETFGKGVELLKDGYNLKFNERPYIDHLSFLYIAKAPNDLHKRTSIQSTFFKKNFISESLLSEKELIEFKKGVAQFETLLNESKYFSLKELTYEQFLDNCLKYENLSFNGNNNQSSDIYQDKQNTIIGRNNISIVALNSLKGFPLEYSDSFVDPAYRSNRSSIKFSTFYPIGLGLKEDHIVNQVFIKEPEELLLKTLNKTEKDSSMFSFGDNDNLENIKDVAGFKEHLSKGYKAIRYHCNVMVWDYDQKKLENLENLIISGFNKIKLTPNITYGDTLPLYYSCYPGNIADIGLLDQTFYLLDIQAAALNIYETNTKSSFSDFGIMLSDRLSGAPIYVDISDEPIKKGLTNNRNKIIVGPSGSGKSFCSNNMINSYLMNGAHVILVDVGDSYERLCQLSGGVYFKYSLDKPISFNPFSVTKETLTIEKKEGLITLIFTLWKKRADDNTRDEYKILSDSINKYFEYIEQKNIPASFNSYYEFMLNVFTPDLKEKGLEEHFSIKSFFNVLAMFYKGGEFDYLLNSDSDLDLLNEQFIVFELDNIKDHKILFPVVTLMIMETFISKMRLLKDTRKVILIEEAWKAIANEGMAEFMKYLYKTVRKHFGEAILVTQELDDIIGNPIIKDTIIKNCGAKILLDMREYAEDFEAIQQLLGLNENARELVLSLNQNNIPGDRYKEMCTVLGNEASVYGVNVSKYEYATYTTEKQEKEKINELYDKYNDIELAIKLFAESI